MPVNYYPVITDYPAMVEPLLDAVKYYMCKTVLYPFEDYELTRTNRFVLADISNNAFRMASKTTRGTNFSIPITAYAIGELEIDMKRLCSNAFLHLTYSPEFNAIINSMASVISIPMITIFNTGHDYMEAWARLQLQVLRKTTLEVPIVINGVTTTFPIIVTFDPPPVKGLYAFEIEQQLGVGRINTIQHDLKVYFHNLVVDGDGVHPVDQVLFHQYFYVANYGDGGSVGSGISPDTPSISSTTPATGTSGVAVNSTIILNFNTIMNEDIVNENISFSPYVWFETDWNTASTQCTITPINNMQSGVTYTVTIDSTASSGNLVEMEEDYVLEFNT